MESKQIEALLEKYWNCETSLEEEAQLRGYFKGNVPDGLKDTAELFRYFEHQKKDLVTPAFDAAVIQKIKASQPRARGVTMVFNIARIAAGVMVVAVAYFLISKEIRKTYPPDVADTFSDPKLALEETKKAFLMISKGFSKAQTEAKRVNLINEAEDKISGKRAEEKKEEVTI